METPVVTDATFVSVPPTAPKWDFPAGTVRATIESDAASGILPNMSVAFTLATRIKDPNNVHWTGTTADTFRNSISFTGRLESINTTVIGSATGAFSIRRYDPRVALTKTMGTTSLLVGQKSTAALALSYSAGQTMLSPDGIEGQQLIDLLPHGLAYDPAVRPTVTVWGNAANSGANLFVSVTPEIIPNYKGSGRTALVWTFKNPIEANTSPSTTPIITLNFGVIATRDVAEGQNTNEARFIWNNNGFNSASTGQQVVLVNPTAGGIVDTFDFDGDGNTTELIARSSQNFLFTPPRELIGQKAVKGTLDADFVPSGGLIEVGKPLQWRIRLYNRAISAIPSVMALEVLPRVGDKVIVPSLAGEYADRGSDFDVYLTGPVTATSGFTVYYTSDAPGGDPSAYASGANWVTSTTDWQSIRAVKIVMDQGRSLAVNEIVDFFMPTITSADPGITVNMDAVNSFAFSTSGTVFIEATESVVRPVIYGVSGMTFHDLDKNGVYSIAADSPVRGISAQLMNADGTPAVGLDGQPLVTATDANGRYSFTVHTGGSYYVQFAPTDAYHTPTTLGDVANTSASHIDSTARTALFTLSKVTPTVIRNGGSILTHGDVHITKVVRTADGSVVPAGAGPFQFTLTIGGAAYAGSVLIDGVETQITNGALTLSGGSTAVLKMVQFGAAIRIEESAHPDYTIPEAKRIQTGTLSDHPLVFTFENTEAPLGRLTLQKSLLDHRGFAIDESRTFTATLTGPSHPDGREVTLDSKNPVVLEGLIYGEYTLAETGADTDYTVTQASPATISFGSREATMTVTNTEKALGSLTIKKVHLGATGDPLSSTREFTITVTGPSYPAGQQMAITSGTPITLNNLVYGNYQVEEDDVEYYTGEISGEATLTIAAKAAEITVTNTYASPTKEVTATKVWSGGPTDRPSIAFQLYRDDVAYGQPVILASGSTVATWTVDVTDPNAVPYTYRVDEIATPANYTKSISADGFTVTNTYVSPKIEVTGVKQWVGGPSPRPTVTLQLLRNDVPYLDPVALAHPTVNHSWIVDETDPNGVPYFYSVDETGTPENYIKSAAGMTVTNTYIPPAISFTGTKSWVGGPTPRPTVSLQLYQDITAYGDPVELASGTTSHTWANLPKTDMNGVAYDYWVDEVAAPDGYVKHRSADGTTVYNTFQLEKISVTGMKIWTGGDASARPAIELQLYRDGVAQGASVPLAAGETAYTWTDLDYTDFNGVAYRYAVDEVNVPTDYIKVLGLDGRTIMNEYRSPSIEVTATKVWEGGVTPRPTVLFQLYQNGVAHQDPVSIADGSTVATWTVDANDANAVPYIYTVDEISDPEGYASSVETDTLTVTNSERPLGRLALVKSLLTAAGHPIDASRTFTATLTGPSHPEGIEVVLDSSNPTIMTDLIYGEYTLVESGVDADYTVSQPVPVSVSFGSREATLTVTNTEKALGSLTIVKKQVGTDGDPLDPVQAFDITVTGPSYPTGHRMTVTAGTPEVLTGLIYGTYYVEEDEVEDYAASISGEATLTFADRADEIVITNTYTSPKIDITATKVWEGGVAPRPTIAFQLYRDGTPLGDARELVDGTLTATWNVDKTDVNRNEYVYTVQEVDVPEGYLSSVATGTLTVTNREAPLGQLALVKELFDHDGDPIVESRQFEATVTGPSFPEGSPVTLDSAEPLVLEGLIYGEYSLVESGAEATYTVIQPEPVTIDFASREATLTVSNTEKAIGTLTVSKEHLGATGDPLDPDEHFDIIVWGPSFPDGLTMRVSVSQPRTLTDLIYGFYWVTEPAKLDYTSSISPGVSLSVDDATGEIVVTNRYVVPTHEITATKVWEGGVEPRPTIQFQLYQDAEPYGDPVDLVSGETTTTWSVPRTDSNRNDYTYTVQELFTPEGYLSSVATDTFTVTNREAPLGTLTLSKELFENDGTEIEESRTFSAVLTGPSYPDGLDVVLDSAEPVILEDLIYGEYTLVESGADELYTVVQPEAARISFSERDATLTVSNTERALGSLTITKVHTGTTGDPLDPDREFTIVVTGPSFPGGREMTITAADPIVLENLVYGEYRVEEKAAVDYSSSISGAVTLSIVARSAQITVSNTYVSPKLELTATKVWAGGSGVRPTIQLQLHRNGEAFGDPVSLPDGTTTARWTVDATGPNGEPYSYTVTEPAVPNGYTASIDNTTLTVTNRFTAVAVPEEPEPPVTPTKPTPPTTGPPKTVTVPTKTSPKTGDAPISALAFAAAGLGVVGAFAARRRRRTENE